ncbi:alpha-ketoglutarate-dependent dioxygenase AlkB [Vibrio vulnificus]|uniref:alpha-ketoglutarate-dependent dioxygenase AlkB family protein n=1 Tax=Vibrio vulnificus TaxID=672 RepID=UPI00405A0636
MSSSMFLFDSPDWLTITDGQLLWWPTFLSQDQAETYFAQLKHELPWEQKAIQMFGRQVLQPRPWTPTLLDLKARCENASGHLFNSVLANLYRNGQDSMGWHQDDEPELGGNPVIASVNLGESRRFVLQHLITKEKIEFELTSGSLLIMAGSTQHYWRHCVPKTAKAKSERINLTFRQIIPTAI